MSLRLSYSSISTYERCPFQYYLAYVEKLEAPRSPALSFGSSLHAALERFHSGTSKAAPTLEDLLGWLDQGWESEGYADTEEEEAYKNRAREILSRYFEAHATDPAVPVALEQRFLLPMDGWELSGVMDRVDRHPNGSYEIIDYKTNSKLPPLFRLQSDIQLPIYQMAAMRVLGIKPAKLTYHYLIPDQRYSTRAFSSDELESLQARLQDVAKSIRRGEFDPRPNSLCGWCDVRPHCPLEQQGTLRIPSLVDAYADLIRRRDILDERLRALREELSACASTSGADELCSLRHRLRIGSCEDETDWELREAEDPAEGGVDVAHPDHSE